MSSIVRTNMKRLFREKKGKKFYLNPTNNRKRTHGRIIQVDPKTEKVIRHFYN